jgi:hypothetical protein
MADSPKNYSLNDDVAGVIWAALFESGNDELARLLAETMIAQGCQELKGTTDLSLILMFWKTYMEDNNILHIVPPTTELN